MEEIMFRGKVIKVDQDDDMESPREWDNLGNMICWHRRYSLGDEHSFDSPEDFAEQMKEKDIALKFPLYLYDHSGISISAEPFHCQHARWDSGQVGWLYVTKQEIRKEYSVKRISKKVLKLVEKVMLQEVETYDDYLRGNVYGFDTGTDSCWGFYGSDFEKSGLLSEARSFIDYEIKTARERHFKKLKTYIRYDVPVLYRQSCPC